MSFLSPIFLLLGIGAGVPLLIHLLRRRVGTRIDFPAVRYLLRAEQENRRTLRLRNLLLMILRVATVLLLTLAAARPIGNMLGIGHAPAAIAIVIDNSLSSGVVVGGHSMLDRYQAAAMAIVGSSTTADRFWVVSATGSVAGGDGATIRAAIFALQPSGASPDLPGAVRRASGLVRAAAQTARAVVVLTDAQRSTWPVGAPADQVRTVVWSPDVQLPDNHAVLLADARPIRWTPRGEIAARFQSRDSVTFRVTLAGRTLARGTAAPNEETTIHAAPAERGWVGGSVDLAPDELAADDSRYFAVWIGAAPGTQATPGAGEFVVAALDALKASGRVTQGTSISVGPAEEINALPAMIAAPSDPVHLGAANRSLERLGVPWRFGARRQQHVDVVGAGLGTVAVADRYELLPQPGADADTLAAAGPSPWIVAGGRYVLLGSPLLASASTLPVRANFVPWLAGAIADRLSGEPGTVVAASPGAIVRRPAGVDQIERPDGTRSSITDSVSVPASPGVYFFITGARRTGAIVVNPPTAESKLDRLTPAELAHLLPGSTVVTAADSRSVESSAYKAASTRSLTPPILIAVIIALIGEALLVTARRRDSV